MHRASILGLMLLAVPLFAASQADAVRETIEAASAQDNAGGAGGLLQALLQASGGAIQHRNNIQALREWEELMYDCQEAVGKMRSADAHKTFAGALTRLSPPAAACVVRGLMEHPASTDVSETVAKMLMSAQDLSLQVACIDLLGRYGATEGVEAILKQLRPNNAVCSQIAALRALGQIPDKKSIPAIVGYLGKIKGSRMRYEANAALKALTGQAFAPDAGTWDNWWKNNGEQMEPPKEPKPELNAELRGEKVEGEEEVTYYEIPLVENRIVFLFDTSGSMTFGGQPNRFEKAREELKNLIARLDESRVLFNIVLFSGNVRRWQQTPLVPASAANKKAAQMFLDAASPGGATATVQAVEEALREISLINSVETVFLLSDGMPIPLMMHSKVRRKEEIPRGIHDIRRRFQFINQTLKVRIHTIGVYTRAPGDPEEPDQKILKEFLENVAKDNDGVYKEVP